MAIKLISGLPGAGKTLSMVDEACKLKEKAAKDHASPRPMYAVGIDGLREDIATTLEHPRDWMSLPDGSIVLIDEAWKHFAGGPPGSKNPDYISSLAEHRHRGFDFIMATQHPSQIGKFTRDLTGSHIHLKRRFGTHRVARVEFQEVVTDLQSQGKKKLGIQSEWAFPKSRFELYKSSTLHTVKRKIPLRTLLLPLALVVVPLLLWYGYKRMHHLYAPEVSQSTTVDGAVSSDGQGQLQPPHDRPLTAKEWVEARTPRVAGIPWSAPLWDKLETTTVPDMICAITERDDGARDCHCYTEQVTPIDGVSSSVCFKAAKEGVYNPYRKQIVKDNFRDKKTEAGAGAPAVAPASGQPSLESHLHGHEGFSQSYTPPESMDHLPSTVGYVGGR